MIYFINGVLGLPRPDCLLIFSIICDCICVGYVIGYAFIVFTLYV